MFECTHDHMVKWSYPSSPTQYVGDEGWFGDTSVNQYD